MWTDGKDNVLCGSSVIKKNSCIQMAVHSSWNEGRNFIHMMTMYILQLTVVALPLIVLYQIAGPFYETANWSSDVLRKAELKRDVVIMEVLWGKCVRSLRAD